MTASPRSSRSTPCLALAPLGLALALAGCSSTADGSNCAATRDWSFSVQQARVEASVSLVLPDESSIPGSADIEAMREVAEGLGRTSFAAFVTDNAAALYAVELDFASQNNTRLCTRLSVRDLSDGELLYDAVLEVRDRISGTGTPPPASALAFFDDDNELGQFQSWFRGELANVRASILTKMFGSGA